jgi:soluble lytic murein transglycosylase-like protein/tetratricopeptide (TPR) repeat protein
MAKQLFFSATVLFQLFILFLSPADNYRNAPVSRDKPSSYFIARGNEFYKQREFAPAISNFLFAKDLEPNLQTDFTFIFKLGYCYKALNYYSAALGFFQMIRSDSLMADYTLFQIADIHSRQTDSVATAINDYKYLLRRFPSSVFQYESRLALVQLLIHAKQYPEADVHLNLAAAYAQHDKEHQHEYESEIAFFRGVSLMSQENYQGALEQFRRVIKEFHYTEEAYHAKSYIDDIKKKIGSPITIEQFIDGNNVLILQGYFQQALNELAEARIKYPVAEAQQQIDFNIAKIYFAQGAYAAAIPRYQDLWKRYSHKEALFNLAKTARYQGDLDLSIKAYLEYRKKVRLSSAWINYVTYEIANNYSAKMDTASRRTANRYYAEVREKAPLSTLYAYSATFRIAFNHYELAEYDSCVAQLGRLKNHLPFISSRCDFWIAKSYEKMGRKADAGAIYDNLAKTRWTDYYGMLSYTLHRENHKYSTAQIFYVAGDSNPANHSAYTADGGTRLMRLSDNIWPALEGPFKKAWISQEVLETKYAERELKPIQEKHFRSYESAVLFINFLEFLQAYDMAVESSVLLKKKFRNRVYLNDDDTRLFYPKYYRSYIHESARKYRLDESLIFALIKSESAFKTYIISHARAVGLMQIMPFTGNALAKELDRENFVMTDLQKPEESIRLGTYYLSQQARQYNNFIPAVLGAYNAGPHRANFWMRMYNADDPEEFPENVELIETNNYIKRILLDRWIYSQLE